MTDNRTKEQVMQAVDERLPTLPIDIQNAAAIYAQGLMTGLQLKAAS